MASRLPIEAGQKFLESRRRRLRHRPDRLAFGHGKRPEIDAADGGHAQRQRRADAGPQRGHLGAGAAAEVPGDFS